MRKTGPQAFASHEFSDITTYHVFTPSDGDPNKWLQVKCPDDHIVIGGGHAMEFAAPYDVTKEAFSVDFSWPSGAQNAGPSTAWVVGVRKPETKKSPAWSLKLKLQCLGPPPPAAIPQVVALKSKVKNKGKLKGKRTYTKYRYQLG